MRPNSLRRLARGLAAALVLGLAAPGAAAALHTADGVPPRLDRIIVIVMENKSYDVARAQPYTASLIAAGASFSSSYAVTHPSQPNYLALWSGDMQGVSDDHCPPHRSPYGTENLGHACEANGLEWRTYSEDLPTVGSTDCSADIDLYLRRHCPWTDFSNLDHSRERPYGDLAADRAAGTLPALAFVIPNNCDNSHDCSVAVADAWLAANVPAMLDSLGPAELLVLTWDEDDQTAANHILTVFVGPRVRPGYASVTPITHYTVLRTICEALGIAPFAAAANESTITDVWLPSTVGVPLAQASELALAPITPNPLRGVMAIEFALPRESRVRVGVFDAQGRQVAALADRTCAAGRHRLRWDAGAGLGAPPGLYFVRLTALDQTLVRRVVRLR